MLDRAGSPVEADQPPVGVIDIGSNSVRLVVYEGGKRCPLTLFNEKGTCELGRGVARDGAIDAEAMATTMQLLERFRALADHMGVTDLQVVATAAVRDASNGQVFLDQAHDAVGHDVLLLSGADEARLAAAGVLSGMPDADGIVGDLGGGSLELTDVEAGEAGDSVSLPIGTLRLLDGCGSIGKARKTVDEALAAAAVLGKMGKRTLYVVGGTWRALARIHMERRHYPLHMIDHYAVSAREIASTAKLVSGLSARSLRAIPGVSASRIKTIPYGALVMERIVARAKPRRVVFSAHGVRDGLLFSRLSNDIADSDPLIASATDLALERTRSIVHANEQFAWMEPMFSAGSKSADDPNRRLREAACLVADIAWRAHPDYRGHRCIDIIGHGALAGVAHSERAFIALAVYFRHEARIEGPFAKALADLLDADALAQAQQIGAAMRLAHVLAAHKPGILPDCRLSLDDKHLTLTMPSAYRTLVVPKLEKRFAVLADRLEVSGSIEIQD